MQLSTQTQKAARASSSRALFVVLCLSLAPSQASAAKASQRKPEAAKAQRSAAAPQRGTVPPAVMLRIVRAEDERRWEESDLGALLSSASAAVRARAALAAGRIGDEGAVAPLATLLRRDTDAGVR